MLNNNIQILRCLTTLGQSSNKVSFEDLNLLIIKRIYLKKVRKYINFIEQPRQESQRPAGSHSIFTIQQFKRENDLIQRLTFFKYQKNESTCLRISSKTT
jgi:hypothetical protein